MPIADANWVTYSYASHIVGSRLGFRPEEAAPHWLIPLDIFVGLSRHFVSATYIGGFSLDGREGKDFKQTFTTAEVGVNVHITIIGPLSVAAEVHQLIPFGNELFDRRKKDRRAYKGGLAISF